MTIKKIIKYATKNRFIILLLLLSAIIPFQAHAGMAEKILARVLYWILSVISMLVYFAGLFFDSAVNLAMGPVAKDLFTNPGSVVVVGWQIVRDVANIFFLFALLYIGISMILQLAAYGSKKILLGVIIAALLVNFSLPVTRLVIDFSNIIAMEFLCKMTNGDCTATYLSSALAEGLSFQTIFGEKDTASLQANPPGADKILIALPFGIIVLLVAAFVIFAGAILILIRTVVLMILAIFSPLAFLFMALPGKAGSYANMWWDKLFSQCFFLPAYMFMLYLVVMMVVPSTAFPDGQLTTFAGSQTSSFMKAFTQESGNAAIITQYILMIILLIASLLVAQQLGAYGASGMIKLGQKAKGKAIGYAGRGARRVAGKPAELFAAGEAPEGAGRISRGIAAAGRGFGKAAKYIPGAGYAMQGVAGVAAANRAKVAEIQKGLDKNNDAELKSIAAASSGFTRVAALSALAKRENLTPEHGTTSQHIKALPAYMRRYGMGKEAEDIEKLNWQYAETDEERQALIPKLTPSVLRKIAEHKDLSEDYFKEENMQTMQESFGSEHYKAIFEAGTAGTEATHKFFESLTAGSKSIAEVAQKLENLGTVASRRTATWAQGTGARVIMETYLGPQPEKKEPPKESPKEGTREYAEDQWKRSSKK